MAKVLTISWLYIPYLEGFYNRFPLLRQKSYVEQYNNLLNDTSEPVGAYTVEYNRVGFDAICIFANAEPLQRQWAKENGNEHLKGFELIQHQIAIFCPDVLIIDSAGNIPLGWIAAIRNAVASIKLVAVNHCAPYNDRILRLMSEVDLVITCTPGLCDSFRNLGLNSYLVYHAFNPNILKEIDSKGNKTFDFVFSGSLLSGGGYHADRIKLLQGIVDDGINIKIFGNLEKSSRVRAKQTVYYAINFLRGVGLSKLVSSTPLLRNYEEYADFPIKKISKKITQIVHPPVFGLDMYNLLHHSKIVLNSHGGVAGNFAGNVRLFEATGVGSCLLTDNKINISELFDVGSQVVVYDSIDDCLEKARWLLDNEDKMAQIAENGQKRTLSEHNVHNRCLQIKEIIAKALSR